MIHHHVGKVNAEMLESGSHAIPVKGLKEKSSSLTKHAHQQIESIQLALIGKNRAIGEEDVIEGSVH